MKKIVFHYTPGALTQDYHIVLVFKPPTKQRLGDNCNIVAWKAMKFLNKAGNARNRVMIDYNPALCFGVNDLEHGNISCTTSDIGIEKGHSVTLINDSGVLIWDDPVPLSALNKNQPRKAYNRTDERRWISIGTVESQGQAPTFLWRVSPTQSIEVMFDSTLMAFISDQYAANDIITDDIMQDVFWKIDLHTLPSVSNFRFHESPQGEPMFTDFHHIKADRMSPHI